MIDPDKIVHIIPVDDLEPHTAEIVLPPIGNPFCECKCRPSYIFEEENMVVVHNSFDGREIVEELIKEAMDGIILN